MELKVDNQTINYVKINEEDYISITDMLNQKLVDMEEHMRIKILHFNLGCGLVQNLNYYLLKNLND